MSTVPAAMSAHVLLVEDEIFLREALAEYLQESGYEVHAVGDGDAGLEVLRSDAAVDVLVSDIRLPGISGYELAAAGRALRDDLKLILMTGYAPSVPPDLKSAVFCVLQKPFRIERLPGLLAAALSGAKGAPA